MIWKSTRFIFILILVAFCLNARAAAHEKEKFDAGSLIIEHILDNHEWHIIEIGEKPISIPLPILLIYDGRLYAFMSSKFHHGHSDYQGFRLMLEGDYKGKIVHIEPSGEISAKQPIDLSMTKNVVSILMSAVLLAVIFISVSRTSRKRGSNQAPKGLQNMLEPIIIFVRDDIAKVGLPAKYVDRYLPYLLTLFFFILVCNLLGLIPFFPGGANVTGNIAVTFVLAMLTFIITTFSGKRAYFRELVDYPNAPWWVKIPIPLMPAIEIMSLFTKPLVLMIRLFANIMAGHIMILGFITIIFIIGQLNMYLGYGTSLVSMAFGLFISGLELIVAFVQAFVFTLLTSMYIGAAVQEHHS
ncbi:MAG: F0F1 ATP synthase subunit A [Bacteroidales bacterium]|jgi:F-type H+-transporting ATPase subunit a|nr:F0F1 ATP synthase subunit A [Bacteroidales bacterium]